MSKLPSLQSTLSYISNSSCSVSNENATLLIREISAINSTDVTSAESHADQLVAAIDALDARRSAADAAVRSAAAETLLLVDRLASLGAQLANSTRAVDGGTAGITELQDELRWTVDDVNGRAWDSAAEQMRSSVVDYQTWIDSLKLRRDDLREQLARMTSLLAMFT